MNMTNMRKGFLYEATGLGAELDIDSCDTCNSVPDLSWRSGRRIVELGLLADKMFCVSCNVPLHLKDTTGERRGGFGSTLFILCTNPCCETVTDVPTGKVNNNGAYDISDKVIIGNLFIML